MKTLMTGFFVVVGAGFVINGAEEKSDPWRAVRFLVVIGLERRGVSDLSLLRLSFI